MTFKLGFESSLCTYFMTQSANALQSDVTASDAEMSYSG